MAATVLLILDLRPESADKLNFSDFAEENELGRLPALILDLM